MGIRDWFKRKRAAGQEAEAKASESAAEAELAEEMPEEAFEADEIMDAEPKPRLEDMDFSDFWHDTRESERRYISAPLDQRAVRSVQEALGVRLPHTFVELMKIHNGGLVNRCWFPLKPDADTYADYVQITGMLGIGFEAPYSLCGRFGSAFLLENYENLKNGCVAFANAISPTRALIMLDYRKCGANGEPEILFVNAESGEESVIARNFETFVRGLRTSLEALAPNRSEKEN